MRKIAAGEFKARCLRLMDEVRATREPVLITKNGKPVAQLTAPPNPDEDWLGSMRSDLEILGDLVAPVDSPELWEPEL